MAVSVTKIIEWDMGHRVPNHKSKCRNPHGHRYRLEATIGGPIINAKGDSSEGMVIDFGDIKTVITEQIHDVLDHGFMLYEGDDIMRRLLVEEANDKENANFNVIVVPFIPTAENMVVWCFDQIKDKLPSGTEVETLRLFETPNSWVDYSPTY